MDDAIKAGARRSAADRVLGKAMSADVKAFALKAMDDADDFATKMSDYLKALGFEDEDGDGEVTPDEAADQADEEEDEEAPPAPPFAAKALDLATRADLVSDAVHEALEELGMLHDGEPDAMDGMAEQIGQITGDFKDHAPDECSVYVYDDHAVACLAGANWRVPYAVEGGTIVLGDPGEWARVEMEWADIPGAALPGAAVKMLEDGTIIAQAVFFGSADATDLSPHADYFTKSTDFWLGSWDRRPMLYHHGMDPGTKDAPRIGEWVKAWVDDAGVWLQGQLDAAHKYHAAIKELARRGLLRVSTDSAPHLVQRERQANGAHFVKAWPLLAASLTVSPAEPRLMPAELKTLLADLGLSIDSPEVPGATLQRPTSAERDAAARRLALELDLLELETTWTP